MFLIILSILTKIQKSRWIFLLGLIFRITFQFPLKKKITYAIDENPTGFNVYNLVPSLFLYSTKEIKKHEVIHCILTTLTKDNYGNWHTNATYRIAKEQGLNLIELGKLKIFKSRLPEIFYNFWVRDPNIILKTNLRAFFDLYDIKVFIIKQGAPDIHVITDMARDLGIKTIYVSHGHGNQMKSSTYYPDVFCSWHQLFSSTFGPFTKNVITGLGTFGLDTVKIKPQYKNKLLIIGTAPTPDTKNAIFETYKQLVHIFSYFNKYQTIISLRNAMDLSYPEEILLKRINPYLILNREKSIYSILPTVFCGVSIFASSLVGEMRAIGIPSMYYFISPKYEYLIGENCILTPPYILRTPEEGTEFVNSVINQNIKESVTHDGNSTKRVINEIVLLKSAPSF